MSIELPDRAEHGIFKGDFRSWEHLLRIHEGGAQIRAVDPTARTLEIENFRWLNRTKKWELLNRMGVCHYCLLFSTGKLESEEREQSREDVAVPLVSSTCKNIRYP